MFHRGRYTFLVAAASCFISPAGGNPDPQPVPPNFCRRFSQQTGIVDNKLFIDGGYVDYGGQIDSESVNQTNTLQLWVDLNAINDATLFPPLYPNGTKNASVPSVAGGSIWADDVNKLYYVYGGEYNLTTQVPQTYNLWLYDAIYDTWNTTSEGSGDNLTPAYGASAVDPYRGTGYYYGGWISNQTVWNVETTRASSDLVTFNFADQTFNSPASFYDEIPRAEGAMFWIPAGDAGMLIYFGGVQQSNNGSGYRIGSHNYTGVPMNTIYVFDIANNRAYTQRTSGTTPPNRRKFCGDVTWPEDRSSYNIYIYGGLQPYDEEGIGFGDVWILSIPSFTWTLFWSPGDSSLPHHSATCNVIKGGQLIVMGGWFPNSSYSGCDVPSIGGMHNLYLGTPEQSGDNPTYPWGKYLLNVTDYTVPPNLTDVIGGSADGGATKTTPTGGWNTVELGGIMRIKDATSSRNATRIIPATGTSTSTASSSPSHGHSNAGAIAGGVIGGIAGLALIILAVWFLLRRRQKTKQSQQQEPIPEMADTPVPSELPLSPPQSFEEPGSPTKLKDQQGSFEMPNSQAPAELPGFDGAK